MAENYRQVREVKSYQQVREVQVMLNLLPKVLSMSSLTGLDIRGAPQFPLGAGEIKILRLLLQVGKLQNPNS